MQRNIKKVIKIDDDRISELNKLMQFYRSNPIEFIKLYDPNIKLSLWQKLFLKVTYQKDKLITIIRDPYKKLIGKQKIELMKSMEMDFEVWTPEYIEVYKKGVLVDTKKHKKD